MTETKESKRFRKYLARERRRARILRESDMIPLLIRAKLATGAIFTHPTSPRIEGILAHAMLNQVKPNWRDAADWQHLELPLARRAIRPPSGGKTWWIYAASLPRYQMIKEVERKTVRRPVDEYYEHLGPGTGKHDTSSKSGKAYQIPVFIRLTKEVVWYCVGDPEAIKPLLAGIDRIGGDDYEGAGLVSSWEVEATSEDWSLLKDGKLTGFLLANAQELLGLMITSPHFMTMEIPMRPPFSWRGQDNLELVSFIPPGHDA